MVQPPRTCAMCVSRGGHPPLLSFLPLNPSPRRRQPLVGIADAVEVRVELAGPLVRGSLLRTGPGAAKAHTRYNVKSEGEGPP